MHIKHLMISLLFVLSSNLSWAQSNEFANPATKAVQNIPLRDALGTPTTNQAVLQAFQLLENNKNEEAAKLLKIQARRGDGQSAYALALLYASGLGLAQEAQQAGYWLNHAANLGVAEAQYRLATLYQEGTNGMPQDLMLANEWMGAAAAQGHTAAQAQKPKIQAYLRQKYTDDFSKTLALAEKGNAKAQYKVGTMYSEGIGTEVNFTQAVRWLEMAAQANVSDASARVANLYYAGKGTSQDYSKAYHWYSVAADLGSTPAMAMLATMNRDGKGTTQDTVKALQWFFLAAHHGNQAVLPALQKLIKQVTEEQKKEAQKLAQEWLQKNPRKTNILSTQ